MNRLINAPEEASARTHDGATALYKALYRRGDDYPSSQIVGLLLDAYPPAMWRKDDKHCPLRAACWRRSPLPILDRLLQSRPSRHDDIHALYAMWKSYENLFGDELLSTICYGGREGAEIWMKFHTLLEFCTRNTMDNYLSLHAAVASPSCPLELLRLSYSFFPQQCHQPDRRGKLPLHYCISGQEGLGLPRGRSVVPDQTPVDEIEKLKQLLEWYPQAVTIRDGTSQRLPLHASILSGRPWSWLKQILQVSNEALSQVDVVTGLFPFQLAACTEASSLNVTFELLRAAPHLVQSTATPNYFPEASSNPISIEAELVPDNDVVSCYNVERMIDVAIKREDPDFWKDVQQLLSYRVPGPWFVVHAAASLPSCPLGLLELAVLMHTHELKLRDVDGNLPLHLAVQHPAFSDNLHYDRGDCDDDDEPVLVTQIMILLHYFPEAASMKDPRGRLPLHVAVCSGHQWTSLKALMHAYPPAVSARDERGLYPFQIAAVEEACRLTQVYELLLEAPHLICAAGSIQ